MIKYVRKRDSRKTGNDVIPFDLNKITVVIAKAFGDVNKRIGEGKIIPLEGEFFYPKTTIEDIALEVKAVLDSLKKETIKVEKIQDIVEKVLIRDNYPEVAKAYILYREERNKVRNETSKLMKDVYAITFSEAKESNIKRENANIDGNTAMGTMLHYGSAISREVSKAYMISPQFAYAHEARDIHMHDLDFVNMGTLTCCHIGLSRLFNNGFSTGHGYMRQPQRISSYGSLTATAIQSNQNDQHGGQSIPCFDYDLAPGVLKTFKSALFANLNKYLKCALDHDESSTVKEIELQYGEITSIEFSKKDKLRLAEIISKEVFKDFKSISGREEMEFAKKVASFALNEAMQETDAETYQTMESLISECNTMNSRAGAQVPFSSLNLGTNTTPEGRMVIKNLLLAQEAGLGKGETPIFPNIIFKVKKGINLNVEDPNYDLFKLACRVSSKRLFPTFAFIDAPFNLQYYVPGRPETEIAYMGCRTRVIGNVCGDEVVTDRGNISFTSINLPRLGIKYGICTGKRESADMDMFYRALDAQIDMVIDQLLERYEIQGNKKVKNFPFLMGQGVWKGSEKLGPNDTLKEVIKQGSFSIGFIGLAETLVALMGKHHGESDDAQALGLEIIGHMRKRTDEATKKHGLNFALIATPAEGLSGRFVESDKKIYGEIQGVTDKKYYTNSFHVPVKFRISALKKIEKEAPYHELTNGGHISYIELDGVASKNLDAFEAIIRKMAEAGIGYGAINHPVDRDPVCGFNGIIGDTCPCCGRAEGEIRFERIRRITGYLVGSIEMFNDAKNAEEGDRVKHGV